MPRNDLKAYTTVLARIPQDLADQVKAYATQHRCSVSELIRDGLEMRLEAEVPGRSTGSSTDHREEVVHEVIQVLPEVLHTLSPMFLAQIQDTIRTTFAEVFPDNTSGQQPAHSIVEKGITEVFPVYRIPAPQSTKGHTEVLHTDSRRQQPQRKGMTSVIPQDSPASPAHRPHYLQPEKSASFDTQRFFVGELCPQRHRYQDSMGSLRYRTGDRPCVTCHRLRSQRYNAKKAARRTAAAPQEG